MAKAERPLQIDIPGPTESRPIWSRVGIVAAVGFVAGIAWPRLAGVHVGPSAPSDARPAEVALSTSASAAPAPSGSPSGGPAASASAAPSAEPAGGQTIVVGPGKIQRCFDKKGKKQESCGELQIDHLVVPKLKQLSRCASAQGLEGKVNVGFEVHFEKKEVHVTRGKKTQVPGTTVQGLVQCAAQEMANLPLDEVPHKLARYTLAYQLTFYKPGTAPAEEPKAGDKDDGDEKPAGQTTSETGVTGTATVSWDTALLRKDPKDGEVVARLVRGTRVKLVGRQNDWYKVESGSKVGWVYRGSIGL
jgi:hypothetical protein